MGFPSIYGGVLPLVVVNTAISLAVVRNLVDALLRIVGLKREERQQTMDQSPSWYSYQQQHQQRQRQTRSENPSEAPSFLEEIQSTLPLVEFNQLLLEDQNDQDQCAVCLCDFEKSHLVRKLPHCSHVFHRDCLDKWLNHNQTTCPMCRSSLLTDELARRHRHQEEILAEELALWLSVYHTSGLSRGPWWYRGHGSGFATSWDFH